MLIYGTEGGDGLATLNMGNSNIIGISYSEMNKMKSNLKKSQQMLETSQRNVSTARVQIQVDRGRLRLTEDSLSSIYTEASKRKTKIDKMCSNIDYTIRRFKEVDSRCAQRIKSIGNSYNTKTSLFDKIKNVMLSLGRYLFGGGTSLLNEGQDAFNNLGSSNSNGYYSFIGRGVGVGNYSAMANSQYSMGGLLLAGTNMFASYSNKFSVVAMNYHGAGGGKVDIDKSENKYEHKYEYYAEKGRNSEGIWESVKNYSIAIWERWVGLGEQIFTQIGLINGMEPKWAKLYGEFSAGMLLENFTAVTINGVKAYKNLKTGQVISESEFIAGSGLGSAGNKASKVKWKSPELLDDLAKSGVKYNPDDVIAVTKTADGKLVWLENGSSSAGLEHIMTHADDFAAKGISKNQIQDLVMEALNKGEIVAYQGRGQGRPIYEVIFNGEKQRVAITVGNNGFIVGANPSSIR